MPRLACPGPPFFVFSLLSSFSKTQFLINPPTCLLEFCPGMGQKRRPWTRGPWPFAPQIGGGGSAVSLLRFFAFSPLRFFDSSAVADLRGSATGYYECDSTRGYICSPFTFSEVTVPHANSTLPSGRPCVRLAPPRTDGPRIRPDRPALLYMDKKIKLTRKYKIL